jgi:hypothetical protein
MTTELEAPAEAEDPSCPACVEMRAHGGANPHGLEHTRKNWCDLAFTTIAIPDGRRGLWMRAAHDDAGAVASIDLKAGREGDDVAVTLRAGETLTPETLRLVEGALLALRFSAETAWPKHVTVEEWRSTPLVPAHIIEGEVDLAAAFRGAIQQADLLIGQAALDGIVAQNGGTPRGVWSGSMPVTSSDTLLGTPIPSQAAPTYPVPEAAKDLRSIEDRARDGYERQRVAAPFFAGEVKPLWDDLATDVEALWVEGARRVIRAPNEWLDGEPLVARFARGVLGIPEP